MTNKFREKTPVRTCTEKYNTYQSYKKYLVEDFSHRCGYTDCPDKWFGGSSTFHIDHFIPWKKHPENPALKNDYQNLVYCCSYVNILKSNDEGGYLDPCKEDYNKHFFRDTRGRIYPIKSSISAKYMHKKLKLFLQRYQIIWILDNIDRRMLKIRKVLDELPEGKNKTELFIMQGQLGNYLNEYLNYLYECDN
jgi:hypothetical protein